MWDFIISNINREDKKKMVYIILSFLMLSVLILWFEIVILDFKVNVSVGDIVLDIFCILKML